MSDREHGGDMSPAGDSRSRPGWPSRGACDRDAAVDAFWDAVRQGHEDRACRLLVEWPDFSEEPDLLILAAKHGRTAVVAALLAAGMPADVSDELGATPLLAAA
jgi:hypothetical protein